MQVEIYLGHGMGCCHTHVAAASIHFVHNDLQLHTVLWAKLHYL